MCQYYNYFTQYTFKNTITKNNHGAKVSEIHLYTIDSEEAELITNDVPERSYV